MTETPADERSARLAKLPFREIGADRGHALGTVDSIKDVWRHRELLGLLVRRELRAKYKDSSLGFVWSLVRPLAQLLIYYFAIGQVLGAARQIPSFAIFVFIGLTAWGLFAEIVSSGTSSIVANSGLVKKVYLPREIFPLSGVGGSLFNFAIQLVILLVATVAFGEFPWSPNLLYAPLAVLTILLFATACGILLSALNVYFRDIQHLVEVLLLVLFWASPIVYSYGFVHDRLHGNWVEQVYLANPVTLGVLGMQKAFWLAGSESSTMVNFPPDLAMRLVVSAAVCLVLLWLSQRVFARLQGNFAQEL